MDLLKGIVVLDLSHVLAGPYCTMMMGDYGADVIKVERPGIGDDTRAWGPPFAGGESAYFLSINRNKRSITINMKTEEGKTIIRDLAAQSDVVIENFSPGTMDRLGLGREALMALNPKLIYCSLSGYGQTGPDSGLPGFDVVIQARGGMMSLTGSPDGPPTVTGISIVDLFAGLHALNAILACLVARKETGRGHYLDMALLDSQVNILSHQATSFLMTGKAPQRRGNTHNNIVPYQTFKTKDGYVNIAAGNDKLWQCFCKALNLTAFSNDPLYATNAKRVENRAELVPQLERIIAGWDGCELVRVLSEAHVPAAQVQDMKGVFSDPQVLAREMIAESDHPTAGKLRTPAAAGLIDGHKPAVRCAPPLLGQHTAEILSEKLHYEAAKIAALKAAGVV